MTHRAHVMVYERLQGHLAAELTTLLVAIGVPRAAAKCRRKRDRTD